MRIDVNIAILDERYKALQALELLKVTPIPNDEWIQLVDVDTWIQHIAQTAVTQAIDAVLGK